MTHVLPEKKIYCLHGKQSSQAQLTNYNSFVQEEHSILITTDIAARGLDVDSLGIVLQMDPPKNIETFIHRAGRTARCGKGGAAGILLTKNESGIVEILRNRGLPIQQK